MKVSEFNIFFFKVPLILNPKALLHLNLNSSRIVNALKKISDKKIKMRVQ